MRCLSPSQVVSKGVGDGFILTDLVIIYTRFGSSQPPVSLEITTIASLTRNTSTITSKRLLKKELTYSSNTFQGLLYAEFCCWEGISCFQTNWALRSCSKQIINIFQLSSLRWLVGLKLIRPEQQKTIFYH